MRFTRPGDRASYVLNFSKRSYKRFKRSSQIRNTHILNTQIGGKFEETAPFLNVFRRRQLRRRRTFHLHIINVDLNSKKNDRDDTIDRSFTFPGAIRSMARHNQTLNV